MQYKQNLLFGKSLSIKSTYLSFIRLWGKVNTFVGLFCGFDCFGWVDILIVMLKIARYPPTWAMAIDMAAADDVFVVN